MAAGLPTRHLPSLPAVPRSGAPWPVDRPVLLWVPSEEHRESAGLCERLQEEMNSPSDNHDRLFGAEFKATPCHQRVLKPPGGGSSNIFGAPDVPESSLRRRNQSHLQSSVLAGADMGTPARAKPGNNSYERLFGEPEPRQPSAIKNRLKSNVPIGDQVNGKLVNGSAHNGYTQKAYLPRNPVTGLGMTDRDSQVRRSARRRDGNPVTGEGYIANGEKAAAPAVDGAAAAAPAVNGTTAPAPAQDPAPAPAPTQSAGAPRRVPPGGFSSGLW
ncbi:microtubule-associated protein Jupiter isoform X2 [Bacillus rossius redtenbacheri]|uniref:microtubule-associated protein Jupiter isoform X2 n=1 Tax=Bacillus rossius redtenbacheri TaxID=93214 RepID=UPI002FDC827C